MIIIVIEKKMASGNAVDMLADLVKRVKILEEKEKSRMGLDGKGSVGAGLSNSAGDSKKVEELTEENAQLKDKVARLEYRIKFLLRSLEEEEAKTKKN